MKLELHKSQKRSERFEKKLVSCEWIYYKEFLAKEDHGSVVHFEFHSDLHAKCFFSNPEKDARISRGR